MGRERLTLGIPERIHEDLIVLDSNGAYSCAKVKCASLEHHTVLVVHARAFREYQ